MPSDVDPSLAPIANSLCDLVVGDLDPGAFIGLTEDDLHRLMQLAIASLRGGRIDSARRVIELAAMLHPDFYMPHQYLGLVELRARRFDRAVLALTRAGELLEALPARTTEQEGVLHDIVFMLAGAHISLGELDSARAYLSELDSARAQIDPALAAAVGAHLTALGSERVG
jgi:hypothetical protein